MRLFGRISHISSCSTRSTPSTSCVCHLSVALVCVWIWQTQSRAGSTVGRLCSQLQLRSPLWCRSQSLWSVVPSLPLLPRALLRQIALVLRPCSAGVFASRCRVVMVFSLLMVLRFCLGQCEADYWKILHLLLFPVPRVRWVCMHAELLVQQLRRNLPRQLQLFPVQVEGQVSQ